MIRSKYLGKKLGNLSINEEGKKELSVVTFTYKSHPLKRLESSQKDPQEKEMATRTPVFLPGKSHGQRSLVGYSPWGRKKKKKDGHNLANKQQSKTKLDYYFRSI